MPAWVHLPRKSSFYNTRTCPVLTIIQHSLPSHCHSRGPSRAAHSWQQAILAREPHRLGGHGAKVQQLNHTMNKASEARTGSPHLQLLTRSKLDGAHINRNRTLARKHVRMIKRNDGNTYRGSFAHLRWDLGDNAILRRDTGDRTGLELYINISFFVRQNRFFRLAQPHSLCPLTLHSFTHSFFHS